jgi:hypothetical protein
VADGQFIPCFLLSHSFLYFMGWGGLGYIFGCDRISYTLILLIFWICFPEQLTINRNNPQ